MKQLDGQKLNNRQINQHLQSAVDALIPDVLEQVDLSAAQERPPVQELQAHAMVLRMQRRMRGMAAAVAACLCVTLAGAGGFCYHAQNRRVESVIGIDVNPSVELSINRRERVLEAKALNADAEELLGGMDLEGVDLNVAVNAVVGAMVTHGYLDDLDNAILVTVSNDSLKKSKELRANIVGDIEDILEENQVQAVVYDQQVIEDDEITALAGQYGISYGKAYFLKELIDQNASLSMDDMEELSSMTMEEIAARIAGQSYALGEYAQRAAETEAATEPETTVPETTEPETTVPETEPETTVPETTVPETTVPETSAPETTAEKVVDGQVEIDYVDCEGDEVYVCFMSRVKWKNPTVAVRDEEGNTYAAMVTDTSRDECTIEVSGLQGGKSYTFVLGGLSLIDSDTQTTVKGYFEKPEIAAGVTDGDEDDGDDDDPDDDDDDGSDDSEHGAGDDKNGPDADDKDADDRETGGAAGVPSGGENGGSAVISQGGESGGSAGTPSGSESGGSAAHESAAVPTGPQPAEPEPTKPAAAKEHGSPAGSSRKQETSPSGEAS